MTIYSRRNYEEIQSTIYDLQLGHALHWRIFIDSRTSEQLLNILINQCGTRIFFKDPKTLNLRSISLREKRPYSSQLTTNPLEFYRIDLMTRNDFVKLMIFAEIDHLTHQIVMRNVAEDNDHSIKFSTQSVLCQHIRIHQNMTKDNKKK